MSDSGELKIERGIPMPKTGFGSWGLSKYPWSEMKVGDSFFVSAAHAADRKKKSSLVSSAASYAQRKGKGKFVIRSIQDPFGIRVWRVA
jgi:hypothetical protein